MEQPTASRNGAPTRRGTLKTVLGTIVFLLAVGTLAYFVRAVGDAREAARRTQCSGRCCQILVALHNYHDTYGSFPPAYLADETGKPMHSWRTLLLPYLDGAQLYNEYRFDEPWDSTHNLSIAAAAVRTVQLPEPCQQHGSANRRTTW